MSAGTIITPKSEYRVGCFKFYYSGEHVYMFNWCNSHFPNFKKVVDTKHDLISNVISRYKPGDIFCIDKGTNMYDYPRDIDDMILKYPELFEKGEAEDGGSVPLKTKEIILVNYKETDNLSFFFTLGKDDIFKIYLYIGTGIRIPIEEFETSPYFKEWYDEIKLQHDIEGLKDIEQNVGPRTNRYSPNKFALPNLRENHFPIGGKRVKRNRRSKKSKQSRRRRTRSRR